MFVLSYENEVLMLCADEDTVELVKPCLKEYICESKGLDEAEIVVKAAAEDEVKDFVPEDPNLVKIYYEHSTCSCIVAYAITEAVYDSCFDVLETDALNNRYLGVTEAVDDEFEGFG